MKITKPTFTCEDKMSVAVNCSNPGGELSHTSMSSSYHFVREHSYGDVVEIRKIGSSENISDALTKGLDYSGFNNCEMPIMSN